MEIPEPLNQVLDGRDGESHQRNDRPFHSKRRHKKSRKGCINCKTRKVKCDEAFPTCRSCYLRKTECVYPSSSSASSATSQVLLSPSFTSFASVAAGQSPKGDPVAVEVDAATATVFSSTTSNFIRSSSSVSSSSYFSSRYPSLSSSSDSLTADVPVSVDSLMPPTSSIVPFSPCTDTALEWKTAPLCSSPGILPPSPSFDSVDLKLLWHYTIKTCCTSFTVDPSYQRPSEDILRTNIVSYAFDNPFLLDSVFALACLDLQTFDPSFSRGRSLAYYARAIESYRCAVQTARLESFPALAANSLFLTALTSQNFRDPHSKDLYIIDWMLVWRGITVIIEFIGLDALIDSGFGIIFFRPTIDLDASALAIPNHLFFMVSSIPPSDPDNPHILAYLTTLKFLGSLYLHLHVGFGPNLSLRITTWFTYIPRAFMNLCELRRPRALVILAHYAAFVKLVQEIWWLKGVGERSIADIAVYLGPEWETLLRVPLAASLRTGKLSIARTILEDPTWTNPESPRADIDVDFAVFRDEDPHDAAFRHLQREHQQDADTDLYVDLDFIKEGAQTVV